MIRFLKALAWELTADICYKIWMKTPRGKRVAEQVEEVMRWADAGVTTKEEYKETLN
jgi:hypothetical protein